MEQFTSASSEEDEGMSADRRQDLDEILSAFSNAPSLDLVQQDIGFEAFRDIIAPYLKTVACRVFDVSDNRLGKLGANLMATILPSINLRELNLSYNKIEDEGGIALARVLHSCALSRLELEGNGLTSATALEIARTLPQSRVIELLLSHNEITDDGVIALCPVIGKLRILDLFGNRLTDAGIVRISEVIPPSMVELYLGDNVGVGDAGVIPLAHALCFSNIHVLGLMRNSITDVGVSALTQAAKVSHLTEIMLNRNPMSREAGEQLEQILLTCDTNWYRVITALCSVRAIPRLSLRSEFKIIPKELVQRIAETLFDPADLAGLNGDSNSEEDEEEASSFESEV